MTVIVLLIVAGGLVAVGFLGAFIWAVRSGQFDDTHTPAIRVLFEQDLPPEGGSHTSEMRSGLQPRGVQAEEGSRPHEVRSGLQPRGVQAEEGSRSRRVSNSEGTSHVDVGW